MDMISRRAVLRALGSAAGLLALAECRPGRPPEAADAPPAGSRPGPVPPPAPVITTPRRLVGQDENDFLLTAAFSTDGTLLAGGGNADTHLRMGAFPKSGES